MFVVISEGSEELGKPVRTLEQAFAQVCCRAGVNYYFEQIAEGWSLVFTDGERPDCSPEPLTSTLVRRADAQRELMSLALDGRLKGLSVVPLNSLRAQGPLQAAE